MKLYVDHDRYGEAPQFALVEAVHNSVRDLVRRKLKESGDDWASFVFGSGEKLITKADFEAIDAKIVATGYRYSFTSMASVRDRPDIYKPAPDTTTNADTFCFEHPEAVTGPPDAEGRALCGVGDNVSRRPTNIRGIARYIRSSEQVIHYMKNGMPENTVAIIDDSGGTLTAPICEKFHAVICAGGTVRSHLGILTREYGIPCLMNARISGIYEGDEVEIETTAPAKTAEAYQTGQDMPAYIWRIAK